MTDTRLPFPALLREVAALLDQHPEIQTPEVSGVYITPTIKWFGLHSPEAVAAVLRAFPGPWVKNDPTEDDYHSKFAIYTGSFFGAHVEVIVRRENVCTRVKVGEREVTQAIAVTTREVTVTEPIYEWECGSVLAAAER